MNVAYPVIFTDVVTNILIEVPDLEIVTETNSENGKKGSMADAIVMARDAIGIKCIAREDEHKELIEPSSLTDIDITKGAFYNLGSSIISLVDVDLGIYRKRLDNRMVRRNVTLPNWLNREAEQASINVSKVLQDALMAVLKVSR